MQKGKFVVFEGGEGSGKDTQIELLQKEYPDALFTREPGGTKFGLEMRRLLLEWREGELNALAELFFFSAARVQFMEEIVRPALQEGKTVISNRFVLSTLAYQVYGRERPDLLEFAKESIQQAVGKEMPDLAIVLDLDPKIGIERVESRGDGKTRFDAESMAFHTRVREGFLKHAGEFGPSVVIDASKPVDEVQAIVKENLMKHGILGA